MAKNEKIKHISFNGMTIPNTCDCIWCGSTMERKGPTYLGSGTNQFSLWCDNCGAVVIHAHNSARRITSIDMTFNCDKEKEELT